MYIIFIIFFIYNNGFGYFEFNIYKGKEELWVNVRYDVNFCLNSLFFSLELLI